METKAQDTLQPNSRDYWLDNIKGILITAVVVGHMLAQLTRYSPRIADLYALINSIHMGSFLIISGHMTKRRIDQKDYVSVFNKNIIPYITAQILLYYSAVIIPEGLRAANSLFFNRSTFSFFIPVYQLWYLMAIILYSLFSAKVQPKRHPVLFMIGALAASLMCGFVEQMNVFKLTKIISFYPFFLLGYLIPRNFMQTLKKKWQLIPAAFLIILAYTAFIVQDELRQGINHIYGLSTAYQNCKVLFLGLTPVLGRLVFLLAVPVIAFAVYTLCPRRKCIFSKLGQNSMYVFVLHSMVVVPARCLQYEYRYLTYVDTFGEKLIFVLLSVAVAFILGSNTVKKLFRPILAPNFDIRKVVRSLCESAPK